MFCLRNKKNAYLHLYPGGKIFMHEIIQTRIETHTLLLL